MGAPDFAKVLLLAVGEDPAPAIASLRRFTPDMVCFVLPPDRKSLVETHLPEQLSQMPQRWDWILTANPANFAQTHKELAEQLPSMLETWGVSSGELVIDITSTTPAMAAAMTLVGFPYAGKVLTFDRGEATPEGQVPSSGTGELASGGSESNPWDAEAPRIRKEACEAFNQGAFETAGRIFRLLERHVSGGLKPFYRALADMAEGYRLWNQFHYRPAWEKLKTASKALDLASAWGGPAGLSAFLRSVKDNITFLEKIVLDSQAVKPAMAYDLLAHAKRRLVRYRDQEIGTRVLVRALEAFAQSKLYAQYRVKSWDVSPDQLPQALQETCRTCYLNDIDGKYRLPLQAQFRALAGLGDAMGQTFLAQWPTMKSLLDAADHAVLGQGFEPIKPERSQQLYDMVVKLAGVDEHDLPKFPRVTL